MDRTLIVIKPDAVKRRLIGEILKRFETKGFRIIAARMINIRREGAEEFYSPHRDKPFFPELISFIISGNVVAVVLEGNSAVEVVRKMIGITNSLEASAGTVRGALGLGITENVIHASDSKESFERESQCLFDISF